MRRPEDIVLRNTERPQRMALFLVLPLVTGLTALLVAFYYWDQSNHHHFIELQMKETAKAHLDQLLLTRLWNASHSGVYVEISAETPPNPYLDDPEKIIVSTSRKRYTKLNPAYMTRQISELANDYHDFKVHMSSLKPKNPTNSADEWEKKMLIAFQEGKGEGYGIVKNNDKEYYRYMAPLVVVEECLSCHGGQGYKVSDVIGGISISIPAGLLSSLHDELDRKSLIVFSAIWIFTVTILVGMTWISSRKLSEGLRKELESERLMAAVKTAGAAAHELRQPMTAIAGFSELLKERLNDGEDINRETDIIISQCNRMNSIISRMLNVTAYRTKSYGEDTEIFDLEFQPEKGNNDPDSRPDD